MKIFCILIITFLLFGCGVGMKATIDEKSRDKFGKCEDTRDGEIFYYSGSTARNAFVGFDGTASVEITDINGIDRILTSRMIETYLKCVEIDKLPN